LLDRLDVKILLARLRPYARERLDDPERPYTFVRTTYLDTLDLDYLLSHRASMARSVRVRRYATSATPNDVATLSPWCFLELKESMGIRRRKVRTRLAPAACPHLLDGSIGLDELADRSPLPGLALVAEELRGHLLRPTITTWCRRRAFVADAGNVRITIDQDVSYCLSAPDDLASDEPGPVRLYRRGAADVVELKCHGDCPISLLELFEGVPEAPSFTKYRAGMELSRRARLAA